MHRLLAVLVVVLGLVARAGATPVQGLVYDDRNGDGQPSLGEPGVANAVVALGVQQFVVTDGSGRFAIDVPPQTRGIVWVRVPAGYRPGPVWAVVDGARPDAPLDLGLRSWRRPAERAAVSFVVAADTHLAASQPFGGDLAQAASDAVGLAPAPDFFTILGDITQGNERAQFELVDRSLARIGVPYIPVPGNHDWYDGGTAWFAHYGPDNYSFDIDTTHFVVWNMAMSEDQIRSYLGAELARVPAGMSIVALTHAPPSEPVTDVLRALGVDYVLTGHTHSNRVVDHDGVIEINSEPMLMGGLDFSPAGYRVMTIERGALTNYHRTVVDHPLLEIVAPGAGQCMPASGARAVVAAEHTAGPPHVTARVDCGTPITLAAAGGWSWQAELPALEPGPHTLTVDSHDGLAARAAGFEVCDATPPPAGADWLQVGGAPGHAGARPDELAPPVTQRWATPIGGHVLQAQPVIARGTVYLTATDQGDGNTGGVVALDLATGAIKWRVTTPLQVRGGAAVAGTTVAVAQVDGTVLGYDADTGAPRWHNELGAGLLPGAAAIFAPPAADAGDILIGNQNRLAALSGAEGAMVWSVNPVPQGQDSEALSAIAISDGVALGVFNRALGGVSAWDRATGAPLWRYETQLTTAINASPVVADGLVYVVNGMTDVFALELATGALRWQIRLDPAGFDWGHATVGTPAIANGVLVVPLLYHDLVGLDATSGLELWRYAGTPSQVHTTHYRGGGEAGFESSPVITGDIVWAADTGGQLSAIDLHTGQPLWRTSLGTPVLGGLAVSGDWLVVASYDGAVRGFATAPATPVTLEPMVCAGDSTGGGCCQTGDATGSGAAALGVVLAAVVARRRRRP